MEAVPYVMRMVRAFRPSDNCDHRRGLIDYFLLRRHSFNAAMCDQKGNECKVAHDNLESQYSQLI